MSEILLLLLMDATYLLRLEDHDLWLGPYPPAPPDDLAAQRRHVESVHAVPKVHLKSSAFWSFESGRVYYLGNV